MEYIGLAWDIIKSIPSAFRRISEWWNYRRPAGKVLDSFLKDNQGLKIFVKDLFVPDNTWNSPKLFSKEGDILQKNPNIHKVWPDVEAKAVAQLSNLLGDLGKKKGIEIVEMSEGYDDWESNMMVLGAQAVKCREFYKVMNKVAYGVDDNSIFNIETKKPIKMESGYGYGIIIKASNPYVKSGNGQGILLGGFGVLGTKASVYYFIRNIHKLGKKFGDKNFGVVVRARIASGEQSTRRLKKYDKVYEKESR